MIKRKKVLKIKFRPRDWKFIGFITGVNSGNKLAVFANKRNPSKIMGLFGGVRAKLAVETNRCDETGQIIAMEVYPQRGEYGTITSVKAYIEEVPSPFITITGSRMTSSHNNIPCEYYDRYGKTLYIGVGCQLFKAKDVDELLNSPEYRSMF